MDTVAAPNSAQIAVFIIDVHYLRSLFIFMNTVQYLTSLIEFTTSSRISDCGCTKSIKETSN